MASADVVIGIDLGTTNSLASYIDGDEPRLIANALGETLTPSVVGIGLDNRVVVGREARELMITHPDRCASQFKRRMGTDWSAKLAGKKFSPEELSSLVLMALKRDAEAHLGGPVTRAVITVPAYFNDDQRKATINAGTIAGFKVERIINEPTAAALAYGFRDPESERVLLVFDLGGGTFDVSVVEVMDGAIEVKASSGEGFLGGEDFTRAMAARLLDRVGLGFERTEMKSPLLVSRLLQLCEKAKRGLTTQAEVAVPIPAKDGTVGEGAKAEAVTRDDFARWTEELLSRVEAPVRRALGDAGIKRGDVDEVILVGGATRMPGVVNRVGSIFGKPALGGINPDEVVAMGAAVQAGLIARNAALDDLVVTDVAPFSLGMEISKTIGLEHRDGYFMPIIDRNTTIPVSRVKSVSTLVPNQTEILVKIFQGESRRVEDNLKLGEFKVTGVPLGPAGQEIRVRFTYDLNGVLEVEAVVSATKARSAHVVKQHARGLSPVEIRKAVEAMQALKVDHREKAENRLIFQRATRLFGEVNAEVRRRLEALLDGFEHALELGEPAAIDEFRAALKEFLDYVESGSIGDGPEGAPDDSW